MSVQGGRRVTDHRTSADVGVLFDPGAEEQLALAEKRWRTEWKRRAETMRRAILIAPSEDRPTPETKDKGGSP